MTPALELDRVVKSFGSIEIIRDVTLAIPAGERHAIIGPNGAGKSTLFNLVSGAFAPSSGTIKLEGTSIGGRPAYAINRLGLSRSFQVTNIFHNMSVYENVRCAVLWSLGHRYVFWRGIGSLRDVADRTVQIIDDIGLGARAQTPAALLSYADQRALEIGITVAGGARVILLDEPTAGMNNAETQRAVALIDRMAQGRTLLIVEHDMGVVFDLANRISVLVHGEIIASDTPAVIRADKGVRAAYLGDEAA